MPGQASGKVTRRMIPGKAAPEICADSSSVGSIARSTAAVMMKPIGARLRPCTQPMPRMLAMLKGAAAKPKICMASALKRPMRGCIRKSQPIAVAKPGMSSPSVISVSTKPLPRRSVRSTSQAAGTPKASATTSVISATPSVFSSTR